MAELRHLKGAQAAREKEGRDAQGRGGLLKFHQRAALRDAQVWRRRLCFHLQLVQGHFAAAFLPHCCRFHARRDVFALLNFARLAFQADQHQLHFRKQGHAALHVAPPDRNSRERGDGSLCAEVRIHEQAHSRGADFSAAHCQDRQGLLQDAQGRSREGRSQARRNGNAR